MVLGLVTYSCQIDLQISFGNYLCNGICRPKVTRLSARTPDSTDPQNRGVLPGSPKRRGKDKTRDIMISNGRTYNEVLPLLWRQPLAIGFQIYYYRTPLFGQVREVARNINYECVLASFLWYSVIHFSVLSRSFALFVSLSSAASVLFPIFHQLTLENCKVAYSVRCLQDSDASLTEWDSFYFSVQDNIE